MDSHVRGCAVISLPSPNLSAANFNLALACSASRHSTLLDSKSDVQPLFRAYQGLP